MQAWSFLVAEGERRFAGNEGYDDVIDSYYRYDSGVPNHRNVQVGDLVVLRTNEGSRGVAKIEDIEVEENFLKTRLRCPHCEKTRFNERKNAKPRYMCRREECGQSFEEALVSREKVTRFSAIYRETWQPLTGALKAEQLEDLSLTKSKQNAIRPLDLGRLKTILLQVGMPVPPDPAPGSGSGEQKTITGGTTERTALVRIGQPAFREALLKRYGPVCLITGPAPEQALEAAHLRAFAEYKRHVPEEGAMLRADIHHLFDKGMIAVDPASLTVVLDPRLRDYRAYAVLAGKSLEMSNGAMPSLEALSDHFAKATSRWVQVDVFWRPPSKLISVEGLFH